MSARARARCKYCGAPVRWIVMAKTGKKNPMDPEPNDQRGNVAVDDETGEGLQYGASTAATLREAGAAMYLSHWATCPKAPKRS